MSKSHRKLNNIGKIIVGIVIALLIILVGLVTKLVIDKSSSKKADEVVSSVASSSSENVTKNDSESKTTESAAESKTEETTKATATKVRGYANSFGGYTAAIVANGGNTTTANSYFGKSGLDVEIDIEDNDDTIIQDFKDGKIDFFFMTVNKMSLVVKQLEDSGVNVVIPYLTDTSTGGDGIVANMDYQSIESLAGTKIAMARNSVSTAIPVWLLNESNLSSEQVQSIINNFALYDSTQDAVNAFVHGEAGAVSTWDMTSAMSAEESHLLFSTDNAEYLVIDALVFNKDFADKNPGIVKSIVDGTISAVNDMNAGNNIAESYDVIRQSVPDFASYDDATMQDVLADSKYLGYKKNLEAMEIAPSIYTDFCKIWNQLGFETDPEYVSKLFDTSYLNELASKWQNEAVTDQAGIVATENFEEKQALISKTAQVLFQANTADFLAGYDAENEAMLDEFVKVAKVLNRMVITVEGNISLAPNTVSNDADYALSEMRAERVKEYLVAHGIEASRIITKGNGGDKPIASNDTAEGRQANRNCQIFFYQGEEN